MRAKGLAVGLEGIVGDALADLRDGLIMDDSTQFGQSRPGLSLCRPTICTSSAVAYRNVSILAEMGEVGNGDFDREMKDEPEKPTSMPSKSVAGTVQRALKAVGLTRMDVETKLRRQPRGGGFVQSDRLGGAVDRRPRPRTGKLGRANMRGQQRDVRIVAALSGRRRPCLDRPRWMAGEDEAGRREVMLKLMDTTPEDPGPGGRRKKGEGSLSCRFVQALLGSDHGVPINGIGARAKISQTPELGIVDRMKG